jgi:hypothetical protein
MERPALQRLLEAVDSGGVAQNLKDALGQYSGSDQRQAGIDEAGKAGTISPPATTWPPVSLVQSRSIAESQ